MRLYTDLFWLLPIYVADSNYQSQSNKATHRLQQYFRKTADNGHLDLVPADTGIHTLLSYQDAINAGG